MELRDRGPEEEKGASEPSSAIQPLNLVATFNEILSDLWTNSIYFIVALIPL